MDTITATAHTFDVHTFDVHTYREQSDLAATHLSDVQDNVTDYLSGRGACLASDDYIDLRRAARDAADRLDAAYLALANERRRVFAAWRGARVGDGVTTFDGVKGKITRKGTIAGYAEMDGEEHRFDVVNIASLVTRGADA